MSSTNTAQLRLPLDFMVDIGKTIERVVGGHASLLVPDEYESLLDQSTGQSEVLGVQRLLTLAQSVTSLKVTWQAGIAKRAISSVSIYPMLAVLVLLQGCEHWIAQEHGPDRELDLDPIRRSIARHRLAKDLFADSDSVICADNLGIGLPTDLYDRASKALRGREDFETLIVDALSAQRLGFQSSERPVSRIGALGVIVAELFENTDVHANLTSTESPLGATRFAV